MKDDYFKLVKLKTGEIILCSMHNDINSVVGETHLCLVEPVQVVQQQQTKTNGQIVGETFVLRPWLGMSDSDEFVIATDIVLTIGNLKHEVKYQYINYVTQTIEAKQKMKILYEQEEAVMQLLHDVTPGEVLFVDDENDDDYYTFEESPHEKI
jgi:hypothetical protein